MRSALEKCEIALEKYEICSGEILMREIRSGNGSKGPP